MKPKLKLRSFLCIASSSLLSISYVHAASPIWSGTTSNLWSVGGIGGNWTDADAPVAGDTLNFAGVTNVATSNDLTADTSFAAINFTNTGAGAGAFTLAGNRIILGGNITTTATALGAGGPLTVLDTISLDMILSGNRTITTNSAGSDATGMAHNLTISGMISEDVAGRTLTKAGAGSLTLSGANGYTGGTAISTGILSVNTIADSGTSAIGNSGTLTLIGGTLAFTGTTATTARAVTLTAASGLDVATSGNLTLNGAVSGGFNLTKTGNGLLVLGGTADNADLRLNVTSGLVELNKTGVAANRAVAGIFAIANGATVKLTGTNGDQIFGGNVSSNYGIHGVAGTLDLNGKSEGTSFLNGISTGIVDGSSGTPTLTVGEFNVSSTFAGTIKNTAGTLRLTKIGSGTLTLSGDSSYSGVTAISGGILAISHSNALGNTTGNTTITANGSSGGPRLELSGNINSPENITLNGTSDFAQYSGAISNTSGTNTLSGNITLANPSGSIRITSNGGELILGGTISQTTSSRTLRLQVLPGAFITVNNAIANNGGVLDILGSASGAATGIVTLKAASTGIGNTNVNEKGTLKLGISNAINPALSLTLGVGGTFAGFDFGTLDLAGFNQTVAGLFGVRNTANIGADSNRIVTNSAASGSSLLTVGNSNASSTFNGVILDGATAVVALTKIGTGTQTLVGDSNYSGVTTISVGTLAISHSNALGSTAGNTTISATGLSTTGGILSLSNGITSAENITITGATEVGGFSSAIINTGGDNILSGNITLNGNNSAGIRLGSTGGTLRFSGNISQSVTSHGLAFLAATAITVDNAISLNSGTLSIYSSGSGSFVTLKGVNGVGGIGATNISQGGTLKLGVSNALNTTGNLTIGTAGAFDIGTLDLAGFDQTVDALIGTVGNNVANSNRRVTNSAAGTGTNTLTVGNGDSSGTFNGVIEDGATAKITLTKTGSGTETLAGVNTYSGNTTVSGGILALTNVNANNETSTVTIAATTAQLQLTFPAGTPDTVEKLFIGATQQVIGEYGHTDSGATNGGAGVGAMDAYFAAGTGKLNVTAGPGGGSNYAAWQTANGTTQTIDLDHDNDGVPNGVEFFLGGTIDTTGFTTPLPGVDKALDGALSVTWTKAATYPGTAVYGTEYRVETSDTLTGAWTLETVGGNVTESGSDVKYTFPSPLGTRRFARLAVTGP